MPRKLANGKRHQHPIAARNAVTIVVVIALGEKFRLLLCHDNCAVQNDKFRIKGGDFLKPEETANCVTPHTSNKMKHHTVGLAPHITCTADGRSTLSFIHY